MSGPAQLSGPDLTQGVALSTLADGATLLGQAEGEAVLLARRGDEVFAVGATCTHYGGPLAEGLFDGQGVHCPWHHACFDIRTGEAVGPPALDGIACWNVERAGDLVRVRGKRPTAARGPAAGPSSVVIVGAGGAGNAAAEMLRREGYSGPIRMIGAEETPPVDRPNLSKDYLAGTAPEEWIPLRRPDFYAERRIDLEVGVRATALDPATKRLTLSNDRTVEYGALLLATGAAPIRLGIPGANAPHVHCLRTLADSRRIIADSQGKKQAVVIGSSFIGLEVAASLRAREVAVTVVAPEARPLEHVMGAALGDFVRALHESHGVRFELGHKPASISDGTVTLDDGRTLAADLVVMGVGVRPSTELAEAAGLRVDRGIVVDARLRTSAPDVFAAGDVARWPDPVSGRLIRVEHWVVAEQLGHAAARSMLGREEPFRAVPFFWSQHYDVPINYVGHAESFDRVEVAGSVADRNCLVAFREGGRIAAVASIYRDRESLEAAAALERNDQAALEALFRRVAG
jgi:NADPH-dependent 2,4-dienoyl-CoA reductase/sulfur reductase-like enzyme/nitrite reductase/ring-hydroxylating ferredoxin subunit